MDISLVQAVADGILHLFVSQNGIRVVRLLFCLQKILIDAEFTLSSVCQGVCIKGRRISEQKSVHCQPIHWYIILYWMICLGPNFERFQ